MAAITPEGSERVFLGDLRLTLDEKQADVVDEVLERLGGLLAGSKTERDRLSREVIEATGCLPWTFTAISRCLGYIALRIPGDESVPDLAATVDQLSGEESVRLLELLSRLQDDKEKIRKAIQRGRIVRGVLPMFSELQATLDLRATVASLDEGGEGVDGTLGEDLVPIASIRLVLDSGDPSSVCFQATEEDLAGLHRNIGKLLAQMETLKSRLGAGSA